MKKDTLRYLLNLFYPLKCKVCGVKLHPENIWGICRDCFHKIRINLPPYCNVCGRPIISSEYKEGICFDCQDKVYYFRRIWAICEYKSLIRECIHLFKYKKKLILKNLFSELMSNFINNFIDIKKIDLITSVPMHRTKLVIRGFNQSLLIAEDLSKRFKKQLISNNLVKIRPTIPQVQLDRRKRLLNLDGAFRVKDKSSFNNKNILLIDDVVTTSSTINECAKVLKEAGADNIYALVIARGN